MDRMKRLIETIRTLLEGEFSGYIKINFSQGSLGRIEKSEELEYDAIIGSKGKDVFLKRRLIRTNALKSTDFHTDPSE